MVSVNGHTHKTSLRVGLCDSVGSEKPCNCSQCSHGESVTFMIQLYKLKSPEQETFQPSSLLWSCQSQSVREAGSLLWSRQSQSVHEASSLLWSCQSQSVHEASSLLWSCQSQSVHEASSLLWSCQSQSVHEASSLLWSCQSQSVHEPQPVPTLLKFRRMPSVCLCWSAQSSPSWWLCWCWNCARGLILKSPAMKHTGG